jgi:hypothetical protein
VAKAGYCIGRQLRCGFCIIAAAALYVFARSAASLYLLCACILLPLASLALGAAAACGADISLHIPAALRKGEAAPCAVRFRSRSPVPIACIEAAILVRNTLTGQQASFPFAFPAAPRDRKDIPFVFESAHCGQYLFSCDIFLAYDFLGLHGFRRQSGILEKRVATPELFGLQVTLSGAESPPGGGEVFSVQRKGQDHTEPFQIRDYAEGDSLKQIHWKLTQKLGKYIVTDPSLELELALLLLWDGGERPRGLPPRAPDALAEAFVSACIALAEDSVPYSVAWRSGDNGDIMLRDVGSMDDLYDVVPGIMCAGGTGAGNMGAGITCAGSTGEGNAGNVASAAGTGIRTGSSTYNAAGSFGGGEPIIPAFLEKYDGKRYPMTAYFAYREAAVPEGSGLGRLTQFLCVDGIMGEAVGDDSCIVFTPANYKNVLRDIVL